jgi:predicted kinase
MDLQVRGGGNLVQPFLTRYRELLEDPDLPVLSPFYQCYRALVRGKVEALRPGRAGQAAGYFRFAARLAWDPWKPFLVIVSGLTGSGKSTVARELGDRLGLPVINSDRVRKAMAGNAKRQAVPFNVGIYSPVMTERTYAAMTEEAEKQILAGTGAILDATFAQKGKRENVVRLAQRYQTPLFDIRCLASEETTRRRLAQREQAGKDISDGRWEIYLRQKADYQGDGIASVPRLELNTEAPGEELAQQCERFIRSGLKKAQAQLGRAEHSSAP